MKYRNTVTGAIIEVASVCFGGDWVKVSEPSKSVPESKKPQKKQKKTKEE